MPLVEKSKEFVSLYNNILKPATKALKVLERTGGPINLDQLKNLDKEYKIDIEECIEEISQHSAVQRFERIHKKTFNPNSTIQLRQLFFEIIGLKSKKKTVKKKKTIKKKSKS